MDGRLASAARDATSSDNDNRVRHSRVQTCPFHQCEKRACTQALKACRLHSWLMLRVAGTRSRATALTTVAAGASQLD